MLDSNIAFLRDGCESLLAQLTRSPARAVSEPQTFVELLRCVPAQPALRQEALAQARNLGERCAASQGDVQELLGHLLHACQIGVRPSQVQLELQTEIMGAAVKAYVSSVTQHLVEQTQRDPLTQLFNRAAFDQRLREELTRARRYQRELSLVLFDLDGFKQVNDRFGHPAGDEVLQRFAGFLQASLRQSDAAFRYGGDEFAALLPETSGASAWQVAERLEQRWRVGGAPEPAGISFGVATFPHDATQAAELLQLADARLYENKQAHLRRARAQTAAESQL
jgi:diguanylate cyclase (GGDEF)-like protein